MLSTPVPAIPSDHDANAGSVLPPTHRRVGRWLSLWSPWRDERRRLGGSPVMGHPSRRVGSARPSEIGVRLLVRRSCAAEGLGEKVCDQALECDLPPLRGL